MRASIFSSGYASFWASTAPMLEPFVRFANANAIQVTPKLGAVSVPKRRPFLSETAFTFARLLRNDPQVLPRTAATITHRQSPWFQAESDDLDDHETTKVQDLADAIVSAVDRWNVVNATEEWEPEFMGAGIIDRGIGDLRLGTSLWEFKAVEGGFHAADFRQLATYCALNWAARKPEILSIVLFNPRTGKRFETSATDFARAVSTSMPPDLWADILEFAATAGVSR